MSTYQDVIAANKAMWAWAFTESSGTDFAPYVGVQHATGHNTFLYQQAGPFAASESIQGNTTGYVTVPFPSTLFTPFYFEFWAKLSVAPPVADISLSRSGNATLNGAGYYIHTDGHIHFQVPTQRDNDTGYVVNNAWHLYTYGHDSIGTSLLLYVDGALKHTGSLTGIVTPNPSTWGIGSDGVGTQIAPSVSISMAAVYGRLLSSSEIYANFLASTSPNEAIRLAATALSSLDQSTLADILSAVRKTYILGN